MSRRSYGRIIVPIIALCICTMVVLIERSGVGYRDISSKFNKDKKEATAAVTTETTCLILTEDDAVSEIYTNMMKQVLKDLRVGYDICQADTEFNSDMLEDYDTLVFTFYNWDVLGDNLKTIMEWVKDGGRFMTTRSPSSGSYFNAVRGQLGIINLGYDYPDVTGFRLLGDTWIGGGEKDEFSYVAEGEEALTTSVQVELSDSCDVWMESADGKVPILWTKDVGKGRVAIMNIDISDKYQRGFLCVEYGLLQDAMIYPVINGSTYFLDDFPSPVPGGNGEYIKRDYGVDIASFYSNIWWPTVLGWEDTYGIVHTGVIIEEYSDVVEAPFNRNTEVSQFETFGNMLLNRGGELGFHGYNHMPLCLEGKDDAMQFGSYNLWPSTEDMQEAVKELTRFSENLFRENEFRVYVPPSNILSPTGKQAIIDANPNIKVFASTYLVDAESTVYEQEFQVEEDGTISTPRITSGCMIDDYQKIAALSELNYHYVQNHFMHPDDVLDEDRGAKEGWPVLSGSFDEYLQWVTQSVPNIRNLTGSQLGDAVEVFDELSIQRTYTEGRLDVKLGGFSDEAQLMLRVNGKTVIDAEGCDYEKLAEGLYQVTAYDSNLKLYFGEK